MHSWIKLFISLTTEGGFGGEELDGDILGGDEDGGWDVGDEDLVLPPDLVSHCFKNRFFALVDDK